MTVTELRPPRDPYRRTKLTRNNLELVSWLFMRISGVILIALIFGHLTLNLMMGKGVHAIDFAFVGGRWTNPMWQLWDLAMLWLAMLHGSNGVRTIINDYAENDRLRFALKTALYLAFVLVVGLGTLVIFTFNPCPGGVPADLLPAICST